LNALKRIFAEFRDFKIDKQNMIEISNVSGKILGQTMALWKKRPIKHPNYTVKIVLITPNIPK
jgi:hypothetical protein